MTQKLNFNIEKLPNEVKEWSFLPIIFDLCDKNYIDPLAIIALVQVESSGNRFALRYEKNYKWLYNVKQVSDREGISLEETANLQKYSYGLTQIMGAVAYERGLTGLPYRLFDPLVNLDLGIKHWIVKKKAQSLNNVIDIYAAYNAGSCRKLKNGLYENEKYVAKYRKVYESLNSSVRGTIIPLSS